MALTDIYKTKVKEEDFRNHCLKLTENEHVYLWGANCDIITKELIEELTSKYKSDVHDEVYYQSKLRNYRGHIALDDVGMFYPLSKMEQTIPQIYAGSYQGGTIHCLPEDKVAVLFTADKTHCAAYLGDGLVVEARNDAMNICMCKINKNKWAGWCHPGFVKYESTLEIPNIVTHSEADDLVHDYQVWLNEKYSMGLAVTGIYDVETKEASIRWLRRMANKYYGTNVRITNEFDREFRDALPKADVISSRETIFPELIYVVNMRLYSVHGRISLNNQIIHAIKRKVPHEPEIAAFQRSIRGCEVTGKINAQTLYFLFRDPE